MHNFAPQRGTVWFRLLAAAPLMTLLSGCASTPPAPDSVAPPATTAASAPHPSPVAPPPPSSTAAPAAPAAAPTADPVPRPTAYVCLNDELVQDEPGTCPRCKKAFSPIPIANPDPALCPVSGDPINAHHSAVIRGKVYFFCCNDCIGEMVHDPVKWLTVAESRLKSTPPAETPPSASPDNQATPGPTVTSTPTH